MNYYLILALIVAILYVVAIYFQNPSGLRPLQRNDPRVIKYRMKRITMLCFGLLLFIPIATPITIRDLGLIPGFTNNRNFFNDFNNIIYSILLILGLYLCKIINYIANYTVGNILDDLYMNFFTLVGFRDHIFAPITEEFIYRSIIINLLLLANYSNQNIIIFSPLLFGFAHLHHGYQNYLTYQQTILTTLLQLLFTTFYTTIFGMLQSYLFLKYNNLLSIIFVHLICNLFGFPELIIDGSFNYKLLYYCSIIVGVIGFYYNL